MRRSHFLAFSPCCPRCRRDGLGVHALVLALVLGEAGEDIETGILHCSNAGCRHEYPIVDGIPILVPELRQLVAARGVELFLREDLPDEIESLLGDAMGPDSWFDGVRQTVSTYAWDGYADLDPVERAAPGAPVPGAARRCLAELLRLSGPAGGGLVLDLGCAAGRTSFDLAARPGDALVLGMDSNLALLRLARRVATGRGIAYARRRVGIAFDRRCFPASLAGADRVDFWAGDAQALPFADATVGLTVALNLLDCVTDPARFLAGVAAALRAGGQFLMATPYDWATRATPVEAWLGGHSQRADHAGGAEAALRRLIGPGSGLGLEILGEVAAWPWHTRLHDRASVQYSAHLLAARRVASPPGG